ncbi:MAG: GNAT family N-acetyltransferase [Gemmatimonadaceae bacterium]|jgi:ribosomal protein S18 acetylase RimI-like enzyme|nr:GNAT family N-acetyltransferase [Gemmatimonadaceae bacterium]
MSDPLSSAIIRGSVAPRDLVARVATDPWIHGWWHRPAVPLERWNAYADAVAKQRVRGAQFAEVDDALAAWRADALERATLGVAVGRLEVVVPPSPVLPRVDDLIEEDAPPPRVGDDGVAAMTATVQRAVANAHADGIPYLVADVDARAIEQIWALERAGFSLIDGTLTFGRRITATDATVDAPPSGGLVIRDARADDADAAATIATIAWDRYHADPMLPSAGADALNRAAVANAVQRRGADVAWIVEDGDGVLGFTAGVVDPLLRDVLGRPTLTITVAVTAARARRRGVGRALALHAIHWAAREGLATVEVGAQLRNIVAARTFESAGFRLLASRVTLRSWRESVA